MHTIEVAEAQVRLPELIHEAAEGAEVVIAATDGTAVRLVPVSTGRPTFGSARVGRNLQRLSGGQRGCSRSGPSRLLTVFFAGGRPRHLSRGRSHVFRRKLPASLRGHVIHYHRQFDPESLEQRFHAANIQVRDGLKIVRPSDWVHVGS